jgi:hypothetical protein
MSKLAEIKKRMGATDALIGLGFGYTEGEKSVFDDMRYLLSLIEEKDKALAFYADEATYDIDHLGKHGYIIIDKDSGNIARKALRGE